MAPTLREQNITWPLRRIARIRAQPRNNGAGVDRICAWIWEFGFKVACLVRSGGELMDGGAGQGCGPHRVVCGDAGSGEVVAGLVAARRYSH